MTSQSQAKPAPRKRTAITDTAINAAVRKAAETKQLVRLKDHDQTGLELRIWPGGNRTWTLQCRDATGRPRRFLVGQHPALGLGAAREACRTLREEVRKGADPVAAGRARREAQRLAKDGEGTLSALLDIYARQRGNKLKWWADSRQRIELVFARQLKRPLTELTLTELQQAADRWRSPKSASGAVRYLRPVLKWGAHAGRSYVARDLALITPPATVERRQRVLSPEELKQLLPVLRTSSSAYAAAMQFILLTLARRSEVANARWKDIDIPAKQWRLPETKNGQEHVVPLSKQAITLLKARMPDKPKADTFVFVSADEGDGTNPLGNWDRAGKVIMEASKTSGWTRHDLRRTGATMLGNMGIEPHVVEAALNHVSIHSALAATYNAARYRPQVANALQKLADRLDIIAKGGAVLRPIKFQSASRNNAG